MSDLNVVHATSLARVDDGGQPRRGPTQGELGIIADGAIAIRDGVIVAVGTTDEVLASHGDDVPTIDAGKAVACCPASSNATATRCSPASATTNTPSVSGGASLAEVAARGGGIWSSVVATREAGDDELLARLAAALRRIMSGGVTTLEVKSGYGLTVAEELRQLELLQRARSLTPMQLAITFLGAHVVPRDLDGDIERPADDRAERYTDLIEGDMLSGSRGARHCRVSGRDRRAGLLHAGSGLAADASQPPAGPARARHADAWAPSHGWRTAVEGGAVSAEHLTYTPARRDP